jgi:hypothetical protein
VVVSIDHVYCVLHLFGAASRRRDSPHPCRSDRKQAQVEHQNIQILSGLMTGRHVAYVVLGLSGFSIIVSLIVPTGFYPENVIALGTGVVLLASALVWLQLSYWREGEARHRAKSEIVVRPAVVRSAPLELRNPQLRRVWETMEESRALMALKEKEDSESELREEKKQLGLSDDEEIILMASPSWLAYWPFATLSASSLLISAFAENPSVSFFCLTFGLVGLLVCSVLKHRFRYYLTNYRVLARKRRILGGSVRWSSLSYLEIRLCSLERGFGREILKLEGDRVSVEIRGLETASFEAARGILREKLPANIQS